MVDERSEILRALSSNIVEGLRERCMELKLRPSDGLSVLADALVSVAFAHYAGPGKRSELDVLVMLLQLVTESASTPRAPVVLA